MALTDIDTVKAWANPSMDSSRDAELTVALDAASEWVKRTAQWDIEEATYTVHLNGHDAIGRSKNVLLLPPRYRPVIHSGGDLVTITEDGSALTVTDSYDTSKDVYLVGANFNTRLEMIKPSSHWSPGYANVEVAFKAGYAAGSIPDDLVQLTIEATILMFRAGNFAGKSSKTGRGGSITYEKDLSPMSILTLERLQTGAEAI
jgi:hypothetical protein